MQRFMQMIASGLLLIASIIILWAVWSVRQWLPLLGYLALFGVVLLFGMGLFVAVVFTLRFWHRSEQIQVDAYGGYLHRFGKLTPLAPLTPIAPRVAGVTAMIEAPKIPRLADLIMEGSLIRIEEGVQEMFQGFRQDGSIRYGEWPGVIAASGMQNVGKSVTMTTLVIIALLQGARVVVCDTHYKKQRSLYRKLEVLSGFIEFAKTEQEVLQQTEKFSSELTMRKQGANPTPYILVFDEFASLMRTDAGPDITRVVEEASQEGHGFNMHLMLAVHDFSQDGIGDARIRSFLNWIYCHRMEAGQTKFIAAFNTRKIKAEIAALPKGSTVVKDECNEIDYLIMPMADNRDALIAQKKLEQTRRLPETDPAMPEIPRFTSENDRFIRAETDNFMPETEPLRLNAPRETSDFTTYEARKERIGHLRSKGFLQGEILQVVYNVKPGATQDYKEALAEYKSILVELASEVAV